MSGNNSLIESSVKSILQNSKTEKIKRPPNAFMLFACEHRKTVANQHPDVTNKIISRILGQMWKNTSDDIKKKYHNEAKLIGEIHKKTFPDYVYSPREARLKKMNKKKKNVIPTSVSTANVEHVEATKKIINQGNAAHTKGQTINSSHDLVSNSEYVPNNPEYMIHSSPELTIAEHDTEEDSQEYDIPEETENEMSMIKENQHNYKGKIYRCHMMPHENEFYNRNRSDFPMESRMHYIPPYRMREASSCFPESRPYPRVTPSPFCNATEYFPSSMNSSYLRPPEGSNHVSQSYVPSYRSYWPSPIMNKRYCQERDCPYEDVKPFTYTVPYYPSEYYRPSYGCVDKSFPPHNRNSNFEFHSHSTEDIRCAQTPENEFLIQSPESYSCSSQSYGKEYLPASYEVNPDSEDALYLKNKSLKPDYQIGGYLPSFRKTDLKSQEMSHGYPYSHYCFGEMSDVPENERKTCDVKTFESKISPVHNNFTYNQNVCDPKCSSYNSQVLSSDTSADIIKESSENISSSVTAPNFIRNAFPCFNSVEVNSHKHNEFCGGESTSLILTKATKTIPSLINNEYKNMHDEILQPTRNILQNQSKKQYNEGFSSTSNSINDCNLIALKKSTFTNKTEDLREISPESAITNSSKMLGENRDLNIQLNLENHKVLNLNKLDSSAKKLSMTSTTDEKLNPNSNSESNEKTIRKDTRSNGHDVFETNMQSNRDAKSSFTFGNFSIESILSDRKKKNTKDSEVYSEVLDQNPKSKYFTNNTSSTTNYCNLVQQEELSKLYYGQTILYSITKNAPLEFSDVISDASKKIKLNSDVCQETNMNA